MSWWTPETAGNLTWSFALIGLAWGSILSMPYAMLSGAIAPERMGVGMGVFNMFIVIPQITAALGGINWAYKTFLGEDVIQTMVLAGISLCIVEHSTLSSGRATCVEACNRFCKRRPRSAQRWGP